MASECTDGSCAGDTRIDDDEYVTVDESKHSQPDVRRQHSQEKHGDGHDDGDEEVMEGLDDVMVTPGDNDDDHDIDAIEMYAQMQVIADDVEMRVEQHEQRIVSSLAVDVRIGVDDEEVVDEDEEENVETPGDME